ncbi:MAG TPA: rhomboid family intramembrane serine protease [Polyangiaceae bacterium]|jgi:membrane associated rhomboid family serine protease
MLPLRDRLPTRTFPFVNYLIIVANVLFFLWELALQGVGAGDVVEHEYGLIPYNLFHHPVLAAPTILTSMFTHGGWAHLGGNMLALWIFGDNVEDAVGHARYVLFYLLGGLVAAVTQMAINPESTIPMVGASGAIAAVMGAYLTLYPSSPITILNPFIPLWFFFGLFFELPAWVVAIEFFGVNLLSGWGSLHATGEAAGGVAFFAHIGGFVAGLVLIHIFMSGRSRRQSEKWNGWRAPPRRRASEWNGPPYYR